MEDAEAYELVDDMHRRFVAETVSLQSRIEELKTDYATDPHETTAAQIKRLEMRLTARAREVKALAVALAKF